MIYFKADENKKVIMFTKSAQSAADYHLTETCEDDGLETAWDGSIWEKGYAPSEPEEHKKEVRRVQLIQEINELDLKAIRALRAIQAGTGTEADQTKLAELEEQAEAIRQQIKELL